MNRDSARRRKEWLNRQGNEPVSQEETPSIEHAHLMCTCLTCGQEFAVCGRSCFVICPGCHVTLQLRIE